MRFCVKSFRVVQNDKEVDRVYVIRDGNHDTCYNNSGSLVDGIGALEKYDELLDMQKQLQKFTGCQIIEGKGV